MDQQAKKKKKWCRNPLDSLKLRRTHELLWRAMTGPVLGLDLGTRRIGLAISNLEATMAFPAGHLKRLGSKRDIQALCGLVREREISCIVVGLPIHMDGRQGKAAESARAFAKALEEATEKPVEMIDERWTSVEAERSLRDAPRAKKREKGNVDAVAATLLGSTWLEQQQGGAG